MEIAIHELKTEKDIVLTYREGRGWYRDNTVSNKCQKMVVGDILFHYSFQSRLQTLLLCETYEETFLEKSSKITDLVCQMNLFRGGGGILVVRRWGISNVHGLLVFDIVRFINIQSRYKVKAGAVTGF